MIVADVGDFKAIKSDENINTASGYLLLKFFLLFEKKAHFKSIIDHTENTEFMHMVYGNCMEKRSDRAQKYELKWK